MGLWDLPSKETDSICFFQNCGILPKKRVCSDNHPMKLHIPECGFPVWKCTAPNCPKYIYLRIGSWFDDQINKILFTTAVRFIYCWSRKLTTAKFCEEELDMRINCSLHWNTKLREVCAVEMHTKNDRIKQTLNSLDWKNVENKTSPCDRMTCIAEFTWRRMQEEKGMDCFDAILGAIVSQYPPEIKNCIAEPCEPVLVRSPVGNEPDIEIKSEPESDSE